MRSFRYCCGLYLCHWSNCVVLFLHWWQMIKSYLFVSWCTFYETLLPSSSYLVLKVTHIGCLKVRNALETLLMAVTPTNYAKGPSDEVPPNLINSNLLLSEKENISILLSLLVSMLLLLFLLVLDVWLVISLQLVD